MKNDTNAYMKQLQNYIENVDDTPAKSVYRYLKKGTIRLDIENLTKQNRKHIRRKR